ncbi:MAG: hypothetical protein R6V02_02415 [Candidatus Aminicenantes bacterium]
MTVINTVFNKLFEYLFFPFLNTGPWTAMIVISLLTGLLMLFIFKHTSNQEGIRRTKDRIKAYLLEMRLYKDSFSASMRAQGNILAANIRYIGHSLKPLLVMIIPVLLILIQLNFWFGYKPLEPGESTILKVKLAEGYDPMEVDISLDLSPGIQKETPPLRIREEREIDWRLSAVEPGTHEAVIEIESYRFPKKIYAGQKPLMRISPLRPDSNLIQTLLYPAEKPLPKAQPVLSIEVLHPSGGLNFMGVNLHWLIVFFALSIIFGFSLKGFFGVEV